MSLLGEFYSKAKKKLQDWERPIQKSVSSDLGSVYKGVKNSLSGVKNEVGGTAKSVMNFSQPKIQSFSDSYVKPVENFVQKNPTPYSYVAPKVKNYFGNDASVGGMVKNTFLGVPKATRTVFDATRRGNLGKTVSDNLEKFDYFKPTEKLRVRDFVREIPLGIDKGVQGVAQDTARFGISVAEIPKTLVTEKASGKYYNTPVGRINSFQSEAQNRVNRGDSLAKAIGNPAMDTFLGASDFGSVAKPILGVAKNLSRFGNVGKEVADVADDLTKPLGKTMKMTIPARVENVHPKGIFREETGAFAPGGVKQTIPLITPIRKTGTFLIPEHQIDIPFEFKSKTLNALQNPGLTIKNTVAGGSFDARIAAKNKKAQGIVQKQINNQKAGLPTAEPGFVAPQNVMTPKSTKKVPPIEEYVNGKSEVKEPLPGIEEYVNKKTGEITTTKTDDLSPTYNQYQERAFNKKQERIEEIDLLLNYPSKLRSIGFKKNEIDKIGKEQASIILKLADLGFPKKAMPHDLLSDQVKKIIKNKVSWGQLKDYYTRKDALNTHFLDGIDPKTLEDINPVMVGGRDVYRNFEAVFGKNYPTIKRNLLDPFDNAKGEMFKEQEILANEVFENIVKKLGIKKGSALDKAVVELGEGKISIDQLHRDFPNDWEKVVEADQWFRNKYPQLLHDLNEVREANFPTHPLYPESSKIIPQRKDYYRHGKDLEGFAGLNNMFESAAAIDPALAATSDVTNPKTKWLSLAQKRKSDENDFGAVEGYLDYIKNHSYAKHIDPFIQKFKGVDDEAKDMLPRGAFLDDSEKIGLAEELSKKMDPVQQITESLDPEHIRQILIDKGVSESQSDWMSKELANITNYEKTKSFLKNKLAKNKGKQFENLTSTSSLAEGGQNKENNFLVFIKNFSRDLAGKTNPIDRPFQENLFGRKALNIMNWANSRFKANAVLGNTSSSLAQFFNIPQGFASAGARNSAKGLADSLADIFRTKSPINNSAFIQERYFNSFDKFDEGILNNTKKFAVWMTGVGDKIGTRFIWNSHYRKALAEGVSNPVKYADDWTRKMVAGRGIGEVPIAQKAKVVQMIAPFQLEVANLWYALGDIAKNDPRKLVVAKKMLEFTVASYVMNRVVKEIRGSDVSFDPINAMMEAYQEFEEEGGLSGATKATGRMVGEVVSNLPGGQYLASAYPEYGWGINKENYPVMAKVLNNQRKDFFGEGDPTRFGTGGLPMYSALKNPVTGIITPYGGKQLEKMYSGAKGLWNGYVENNSGKVMTPVERSIPNVMRGVLFGKNAFGEMQDYYDNNQTPLSDLQTEKYKLMGNDPEYFNNIMDERKTNHERDALKSGKTIENADDLSDGMTQLSNGKIYVKSLDREFKTVPEANMAVAMDDFSGSEDNFRDLENGWVLRKGESGNVIKQRRDSYDSGLNSSMLSNYKKSKDLDNWKDTANKQLNLLNKMLVDPNIDDLDKVKIENAMKTLMSEYEKFEGYGGFTKPKTTTKTTAKKATKTTTKTTEKLEEKYRYPLIDPEFIRINALISGLGRNRKFRMERRALPLIVRRLPVVHRTRRR